MISYEYMHLWKKQEKKQIYYADLQEIVDKSTKTEHIILTGDLSARILN